MPVDLPEPPYAYMVDVRPFDSSCVVPHCSISGRAVSGNAKDVELDGDLGSYVTHGSADSELFFRRGRVLRKGEKYTFDVPESTLDSELDFYLSAEKSGAYQAKMQIVSQQKMQPPAIVLERTFEGASKAYVVPKSNADAAVIENYEQHVRMPLPSRRDRMLRVTIENTGAVPISLGSPLVMKRVVGRGPRQAFAVIFDAVPFYLFRRFFNGTGDAPTEFFHRMTKDHGLFFTNGYSPAASTQIFVRRFFRNGYYENAGEPVLRGQDQDEDPPARSVTPIARLAEQGFLTEEFVGNFFIIPEVSSTGVDGGYQNETIGKWPTTYHPPALAKRFDLWLADHPRDDVWGVIWLATTHSPGRLKMFSPARPEVLTPTPPTLTDPSEYRADELQARWENLLDSADSLKKMFESAKTRSPNASRVWTITTDHGMIETTASENRATRYRDAIVSGGPLHRFYASSEETWTPFTVIYDGVAKPPGGPRVIQERTMASASWRALEPLFGVTLGAPETTAFDSPVFSPAQFPTRWVDDGAFSIGHVGALRVAVGKWGYRARQPKLTVTPLWEHEARYQLMLAGGTDRRSAPFLSEELYDDEEDPLELHNVANKNVDIVLKMRRRAQDLQSTYSDPAIHPRHRDVLTFAQPLDVVLEGPRPFKVRADGVDVAMTNPRRASVHAKRIEIIEDTDPLGVVSIRGLGITAPLLLRCGASGQPLDELGPERDRFNLSVARHNCVVQSETSPPANTAEVWFSSELVRSKGHSGTSTGGANAIALEGMKRWGYVRDMDKKH
jgi:hypothetical protein